MINDHYLERPCLYIWALLPHTLVHHNKVHFLLPDHRYNLNSLQCNETYPLVHPSSSIFLVLGTTRYVFNFHTSNNVAVFARILNIPLFLLKIKYQNFAYLSVFVPTLFFQFSSVRILPMYFWHPTKTICQPRRQLDKACLQHHLSLF